MYIVKDRQCAFVNQFELQELKCVSIRDCNVGLGWNVKLSYVKCTFVLAKLQRFAVSELDSNYCVRHCFTFLPVVNLLKVHKHCQTGFLKEKKSTVQIFKMFLFCAKHWTMCIGWFASQICSAYGVFLWVAVDCATW